MNASIITIGDEILMGQTVDTNSAWIGNELSQLGIEVREIASISDKPEDIANSLRRLMSFSDLVLVTGGLGPTNDDLTKTTLCDFFEDELVMNEDVLSRIRHYFGAIKRQMLEVHFQQAMLPRTAQIIHNDLGTASGMWFKRSGKHVISLPGVPYEMKGLMQKILPAFSSEFNLDKIYFRLIALQGIGESTIADEIQEAERKWSEMGIRLAYLPSVGIVKLRLTGKFTQLDEIDRGIRFLFEKFPNNAFGTDKETLEGTVGALLRERKKTVSVAESCTGGALSARIVSVAGSSAYFLGGITPYSNSAKQKVLNVSSLSLNNSGAVSEQVVIEMANHSKRLFGTDYSIATSGVAGPDGGSDEKPVGTVWIAISGPDRSEAKVFNFQHNRERNIELTVVFALNALRRMLLGLH